MPKADTPAYWLFEGPTATILFSGHVSVLARRWNILSEDVRDSTQAMREIPV